MIIQSVQNLLSYKVNINILNLCKIILDVTLMLKNTETVTISTFKTS